MNELEHKVREYLSRPQRYWDDEEPKDIYGIAALPIFSAAFDRESDPTRRAYITRIVWRYRDIAALPTLAKAIRDGNEAVWKDAVDGLVYVGGESALRILRDSLEDVAMLPDAANRQEWIEEAITQIGEGQFPRG